jgi:hypothetical protein
MAGTRARRLQDASSLWVLETAVMQQSADKVRLLMVQTFIYSAVMYGAGVGHDEGGQRQDVSGRKKLSSLALHPRDCSSDVLYGDTGLLPPGVLIDAAKLCWQQISRTWRLADGPRRRCDSHSRVAVVSAGLRWADWCGNVKSITEQIQHT